MADTNKSGSLRDYLTLLESTGNLVHFQEELSTRFEIPAATKYIARQSRKTVIFDHVQHYDIPVVGKGTLLKKFRRLPTCQLELFAVGSCLAPLTQPFLVVIQSE